MNNIYRGGLNRPDLLDFDIQRGLEYGAEIITLSERMEYLIHGSIFPDPSSLKYFSERNQRE